MAMQLTHMIHDLLSEAHLSVFVAEGTGLGAVLLALVLIVFLSRDGAVIGRVVTALARLRK